MVKITEEPWSDAGADDVKSLICGGPNKRSQCWFAISFYWNVGEQANNGVCRKQFLLLTASLFSDNHRSSCQLAISLIVFPNERPVLLNKPFLQPPGRHCRLRRGLQHGPGPGHSQPKGGQGHHPWVQSQPAGQRPLQPASSSSWQHEHDEPSWILRPQRRHKYVQTRQVIHMVPSLWLQPRETPFHM